MADDPTPFNAGPTFLANKVVAIDFGGTLAAQPALQQVVLGLQQAGYSVHIISAVPADNPQAETSVRDWIDKLSKEIGFNPAGIHIVYHGSAHDAGMEKVKVMRAIQANWLIDDNGDVCEVVREAGFECVQVFGQPNYWERSRG